MRQRKATNKSCEVTHSIINHSDSEIPNIARENLTEEEWTDEDEAPNQNRADGEVWHGA